jgi:hypothetical protein
LSGLLAWKKGLEKMPISRAQTGKQVKDAPASKKAKAKVKKVMGEFKKVTNHKQAVSIALSEAGVKKKSNGGRIPKPKCRNGIAIRGRTRGRTV